MGIFDLFSRRRRIDSAQANAPTRAEDPAIEARQVDYSPLVPLAAIISRGDTQVAADMTLLTSGYEAFRAAHPEWCEKMSFDAFGPVEHSEMIRNTFVYWLVGYDTPFRYGAYLDWKEGTAEVIAQLQQVERMLGISLDLAGIPFTGEEPTEDVLALITKHSAERGYAIVVIDTDSDSYHVYVVPQEEYDRAVELGASVGFRVYALE